jgi:hypothetical protein
LAGRFLQGELVYEGKVMNMSEILTRVDSLSDRSHLVTRSVEREEDPVLTLVDTSERTCEMPDPLVQALVNKLPKPNTIWSIDDRARWLKAAAMAFNLIYKTGERQEPQSPSVLKAIG